MSILRRYLPLLEWGAEYTRLPFTNDLIVAAIVTVMLIPQSLAYALLAGLPPQVGLYASIAPLVLSAIFGTSRTLAVGPVAVASLMTAAGGHLGAGAARDGAFITASGIQIAASQLAPVLGIRGHGENLVDLVKSLASNIGETNLYTAAIGFASLAFLFWVRSSLKPLLLRLGLGRRSADMLAKIGPAVAIAAPALAVAAIIIVAVLSLVDLGALKHTWDYSRADFAAMAATILVTLVEGVEVGLIAGVGIAIFLHLYSTSKAHTAVVDDSLYFPNARFIEDRINGEVAANPAVRYVILEVKGPILDRLKRSRFLEELTGRVH